MSDSKEKILKKKCVFIIGPESSGSTLIAKVVDRALNGESNWTGRGFNCCDSAFCDRNNDFTKPCSRQDHLVCHRSLPFGLESEWPPIEEWQALYEPYFIICTRDTTLAALSVIKRFQRKKETIHDHQNRAKKIIDSIMKSEAKRFIWSYETFMFLRESYLKELYSFLEITSDYFPGEISDANLKYINHDHLGAKIKRLLKERLTKS